MIWIVLTHFVFEMRIIREKLTSEDEQAFQLKFSRSIAARILCCVLLVIYSVVLNILYGVRDEEEVSQVNLRTFDFFEVAARLLKLLVDIYLLQLFFRLLAFFVQQKRLVLSRLYQKFTK